MKYKIEPSQLSFEIYRKKSMFSKWEQVARVSPLFSEWKTEKVTKAMFSAHRKNAIRVLDEVKQMDKIFGKYDG